MPIVFAIAIFVAAALLFIVQPLAAKLFLPVFGGTPAVWNTAMLFFQTALLGGYLYAHLLTTRVAARWQGVVHGVVLLAAFVALPIALPEARLGLASDAPPSLALLALLGFAVGLPYFAVSSAGPLLQRWFSLTPHTGAGDPYFLYAASNAGSLLGLLAYPFALGPALGLRAQGVAWTVGYAAFVLLAAACAVAVMRAGQRKAEPAAEGAQQKPSAERTPLALSFSVFGLGISIPPRVAWIALAFLPSSLMLGVTQYVTTDVAAIPLLWVLPLGVYLLTFILAFSRRSLASSGPTHASRVTKTWKVLAVGVALAFLMEAHSPIAALVVLHLAALFAGGLLCHGRLAALRPEPARLTEFYLLISVGGALGGVFNALIAPVVFNDVLEYPLVIALACLAIPRTPRPAQPPPSRKRTPSATPTRETGPSWSEVFDAASPVLFPVGLVLWIVLMRAWIRTNHGGGPDINQQALLVGVPAFAAYLASGKPLAFALSLAVLMGAGTIGATQGVSVLHKDRTFFGVHTITLSESGRTVTLLHGTTIHGLESRGTPIAGTPLAYYHPDGPAGAIMGVFGATARRVGLVGLGSGSLAAYGRPGQRFDYFEIDPHVVWIARDSGHFTFVPDSKAEIRYVLGDGRLTLRDEPDGQYDLLILDAFSSDSIPVHLMTREAFEVYTSKLAPGGVIALHVSNRNLDLPPVVAALAADASLHGLIRQDEEGEGRGSGRFGCTWIVLSPSRETLRRIEPDARWLPLEPRPGFPVWTDNHADILRILRWL
ncbi:MAG: fused MFS/spermidine synthase [Phycisphaerales bacterium]|nr:fused MFS/spermidine synthase [Phycisphaerales bacterium]